MMMMMMTMKNVISFFSSGINASFSCTILFDYNSVCCFVWLYVCVVVCYICIVSSTWNRVISGPLCALPSSTVVVVLFEGFKFRSFWSVVSLLLLYFFSFFRLALSIFFLFYCCFLVVQFCFDSIEPIQSKWIYLLLLPLAIPQHSFHNERVKAGSNVKL